MSQKNKKTYQSELYLQKPAPTTPQSTESTTNSSIRLPTNRGQLPPKLAIPPVQYPTAVPESHHTSQQTIQVVYDHLPPPPPPNSHNHSYAQMSPPHPHPHPHPHQTYHPPPPPHQSPKVPPPSPQDPSPHSSSQGSGSGSNITSSQQAAAATSSAMAATHHKHHQLSSNHSSGQYPSQYQMVGQSQPPPPPPPEYIMTADGVSYRHCNFSPNPISAVGMAAGMGTNSTSSSDGMIAMKPPHPPHVYYMQQPPPPPSHRPPYEEYVSSAPPPTMPLSVAAVTTPGHIDPSYVKSHYSYYENIENWNKVENLRTLFGWITISALNIECLDEAIKRYRKFIAYGTIMGLLFSTASGTISATQFNINNTDSHIVFVLNVLFTFFSFSIATYTGILKTLQVQERLENFIKIKQEWILFSATISSELQLPIHLRTPILSIIKVYKNKFLDLLKIDTEIPEFIKKDIIDKIKKKEEEKYKNNRWSDLKYSDSSSLSDVIIEIGSQELKRLLNQIGATSPSIAAGGGSGSGEGSDTSGGGSNNNYHKARKEEDHITRRDIENIYKQFAIINRNVENLNHTPIHKIKKHKLNLSGRSLVTDLSQHDDSKMSAKTNSKRTYISSDRMKKSQRPSINELIEEINSVSSVYRSVLDGTIANTIVASVAASQDNSDDEDNYSYVRRRTDTIDERGEISTGREYSTGRKSINDDSSRSGAASGAAAPSSVYSNVNDFYENFETAQKIETITMQAAALDMLKRNSNCSMIGVDDIGAGVTISDNAKKELHVDSIRSVAATAGCDKFSARSL